MNEIQMQWSGQIVEQYKYNMNTSKFEYHLGLYMINNDLTKSF